jgi:hypothetical protein
MPLPALKMYRKKCPEIVIGDRGYGSNPLKNSPKSRDYALLLAIGKHDPQYSDGKKLLQKRFPVATAIGKVKALFGFTPSRFRSQISALASISFAILAFNIPSQFRRSGWHPPPKKRLSTSTNNLTKLRGHLILPSPLPLI